MSGDKRLQTRDQARSKQALDDVKQGGLGKEREPYSELMSLPAKLRVNGALATVAYLREKEVTVHDSLNAWLTGTEAPVDWGEQKAASLAERLSTCDSACYAAATEECLAYAGWLKRWAAIIWGESHKKEGLGDATPS